jgi:hypothetical protein
MADETLDLDKCFEVGNSVALEAGRVRNRISHK